MSEWIEWDGSEYEELEGDELFSPVPVGTLVDIRLRNGEVFTNLRAGELASGCSVDAAGVFWENEGENGDIVAYRVVPQ